MKGYFVTFAFDLANDFRIRFGYFTYDEKGGRAAGSLQQREYRAHGEPKMRVCLRLVADQSPEGGAMIPILDVERYVVVQ